MIRRSALYPRGISHSFRSGTQRWSSGSALDKIGLEEIQSYVSTSQDPYLNLSLEQHLLQHSAVDSAVLFIYVNRPSVIIGRNQNPWLEVNLGLLDRNLTAASSTSSDVVDLVRRRSGGGTVFHDEGNVNWSVVCPSAHFTRDKHVEMVVRALRNCGVDRARVNERHDVVLDQGNWTASAASNDTRSTPYADLRSTPLKVSGSAYKLTKNRALHHGTCLLSSPNLALIPRYLQSPAKPYINARGVESVSSPVTNISLDKAEFIGAVQEQFRALYSGGNSLQPRTVDADLEDIKSVREGCAELKSLEWTYLQTPQFTVSNRSDLKAPIEIELTVRHGVISDARIQGKQMSLDRTTETRIHEVALWEDALDLQALSTTDRLHLTAWLDQVFPRPRRDL